VKHKRVRALGVFVIGPRQDVLRGLGLPVTH
jgi:hypothetical protein